MDFFPPSNSPRRTNNKVSSNLLFLIVGVFLGFLASSFLSSIASSFGERQVLLAPNPSLLEAITTKSCFSAKHDVNNADDGWSSINVFYGNTSHLVPTSTISNDYFSRTEWFSQVKQDEIVSRLLRGKRNGYFVDLAANDAIKISNTYALETNFGWRGLCIEPNPMYWASLSYRTNCNVVAAVIGETNMEQVMFKFPNRQPPRGGIVGSPFDNKLPSQNGEDYPRYTVSLRHVFDRFHTPPVIDYLSLDVEGAESFILESFPFDQYRFNILTIERPDETLSLLLEQKGYVLLKSLKKWGETIWAHRLILSSLDKSALEIETENYKYFEKQQSSDAMRSSS